MNVNDFLMELIKKYNNLNALLIIFVCWPFAALCMAIKRYRDKSLHLIITLFCSFYGFTFIINNPLMDANRYRDAFLRYSYYGFDHLWHGVITLYTSQAEHEDIAIEVINYLLSRITNDPRFLFAVFGLIFGYFYSKNICLLISFAKNSINGNSLIFLVAFLMIVPVFYINGFLMYVAAHIFFFGAFHIITLRRYKYFIFPAVAILFHFSYIFPTTILLFFCVMGVRNDLYFPFFVISFFASSVFDPQFFGRYIHFLGAAIESKYNIYMAISTIEKVAIARDNASWFIVWKNNLLIYYSFIVICFLFFKCRKQIQNDIMRLFSFCFLFAGCVNLVGNYPSMGRFYSVYLLFAMAFLFLFYNYKNINTIDKKTIFALIPIGLAVIVDLRMFLPTVSPTIFFSNFFLEYFINNDTIHLLKFIYE